MGPDLRAIRRETLLRDVRQAVIELTDNDPIRKTSIAEVTRRLGVTDSYLLCEALDVARSLGWMRVAGGLISLKHGENVPAGQAHRPVRVPVRMRSAERTRTRERTSVWRLAQASTSAASRS